MQINQPVTDQEYHVPEGVILVSKTDLNGTITECNDAFEAASGFSREELIGNPHNMVRHPSVPAIVFADMWRSLKNGAPWSQIVKNRRKDGGFYWVKANATPIYEKNNIVGYMSVRTCATEQDKVATAAAYKDLKSGRARIKNGRVLYGIDYKNLNFFKLLNPEWQLALMAVLFVWLPFMYIALQANLSVFEMGLISSLILALPFTQGVGFKRVINHGIDNLNRLSSGEHNLNLEADHRTAFGKLSGAIQSASLSAGESHAKVESQLDHANQLQTAIDKVSVNIMIADSNYNITYLNERLFTFLSERQQALKTVLPNFDLDKVLGSNIDVFHKHPAHNRAILDQLTEPMTTTLQLLDYKFELSIIPVFNRSGQRTSILVEWRDLTQEHQLVNEVQGAVNNAKNGILNERIDLSKVTGLAHTLSEAMNEMLEVIEQPINQAVQVASSLSEGDLRTRFEGDYQGRFALMKESMNVAVENLASIMGQTDLAVCNVNNGAQKINQASTALNDRTQNQAASLEETAASMEQMTSMVKQNADNSQKATEFTRNASIQASNGVKVMENAINSIEEINEASQRISEIIGLIDSISFQTNLLALNAAVEAARAGEHGRGFAVVAGEVRSLAQKSADAAKDIKELIENSVDKISEGSQHVRGSGKALNEIADAVSTVNQIIEEMAHASQEQSEGINQVNLAITNIDSAVQQNAALVEEAATTANELGSMSEIMQQNVRMFTLDETRKGCQDMKIIQIFDCAQAKRTHRQVYVKLMAYTNNIDIDIDPQRITDEAKCYLGNWFKTIGKQFQHLSSYQNALKLHTEFHQTISKALESHNLGDQLSETETMQQLKSISQQLIKQLDQLEKDIINGQTSTELLVLQ